MISYTYDAWGNFETEYHNGCTAFSVASYNPFLYRGYYYDTELQMYYLKSRYYDPIVGRFISMDKYVSTDQGVLGNNMFVYCLNNPVKYTDYTGAIAVVDDMAIWGIALVAFAATGSILITFPVDITDIGINSLSLPNVLHMSKGGTQNHKHTWLQDWTDDEIENELRKKDLPKKTRKELEKEQKARGTRNKQKREGLHHSRSSDTLKMAWEGSQIITFYAMLEVLKVVLRL